MKSFSPGTVLAGVLLLAGGLLVMSVPVGLLLRLLGASFDSVGHFLAFFLGAAVLGLPGELLAKALPRALVSMGWLPRRPAQVLFVVLDCLVSITAILLAAQWVPGVFLPDLAVVAASLLLALAGARDGAGPS